MATTSGGPRPPRRPGRPAGSRNPTRRPRKVAGLREDAVGTEIPPVSLDKEPAQEDPASETPWPDETHGAAAGRGPFGGVAATAVLVFVIIVLLGVATTQAWYLWFRDDPVVSSSRPVVTGTVAERTAVDAAATAAKDIVSTSYKDYDDQVEQAVTRMTTSFAEKYRLTAEQIKDEFVAAKTEVEVEIAAQAVVSASPVQVQALLFLNQFVTKKGKSSTYTPYRALVTVIRTDQGWLVSDIETK